MSNGPHGPGRVEKLERLIVGPAPLSVDVCAASFLGLRGHQVLHFVRASELGLGHLNLAEMEVREVNG